MNGLQSRYVRRLAEPLRKWCREDELAELAFPMWSAFGSPCEALRSRDPGQVTP